MASESGISTSMQSTSFIPAVSDLNSCRDNGFTIILHSDDPNKPFTTADWQHSRTCLLNYHSKVQRVKCSSFSVATRDDSPSRFDHIILIFKEASDKIDAVRQCRMLAGRALAGWISSGIVVKKPTVAGVATILDKSRKTLIVASWSLVAVSSMSISTDHREDITNRETSELVDKILEVVVPLSFGAALDSVTSASFGENQHISTESITAALNLVQSNLTPYFKIDEAGYIKFTSDIDSSQPRIRVLVGGSFNPVHVGHKNLLNVAEESIRGTQADPEAAFEFTVVNPDKGATEKLSVFSRLAQFAGQYNVYITNAPTFVQKSAILPNTIFVVGYDTAARIILPKYYEGQSAEGLCAALESLRQHSCRFLVAGRLDPIDKSYKSVDQLTFVPGAEQLRDLFVGISEEKFREDISSTELRKRLKPQ